MTLHEILTDMLPYLLGGAMITIAVTLIALPVGFIIGLALAIGRIYGGPVMAGFGAIFSVILRAVPEVVVLFILFFSFSEFLDLTAFWAGALGLALVSSAYQMEIFRGAILSVGKGQMVAARAIGMSRSKAIRFIVIPQALRHAIPPWSNEAAIILKDSSLVFALGVPEMLRRAEYISARTYQPMLAYGAAALIYFVLVFLFNRWLDRVELKHGMLTSQI
jgi:polar amino acid transport system permease protein